MFEYTHNNHIQTGIKNDEFFFEYGKISSHKTWREECKRTAAELHEKYGDKLVLFLSGGVDSETVLNSFVSNGIKPKVAVMRYERNNNLHDINYIMRVLTKFYISPIIIDVNVEDFFKNDLLPGVGLPAWSCRRSRACQYQARRPGRARPRQS
jgi:asparagine synthetase B (glutamine-hydrolysing)